MTHDTTIEYDVERARLYKAIALAFDRPGAAPAMVAHRETIAEQFADAAERLDEWLGADIDPSAHDGQPLAETAAAVVETMPIDDADARSAYADAFGVEGEGTVSQYEVTYAPGTLVTNTDRIADIAGFYRAFGLDLSEDERDRADALPTQLEFCQHLALSRAVLTESGDDGVEIVTDATAAFLEDHLGRWIPRFVDEVRDEVDEPYYHALVDLLEAVVAMDVDHFDVDPDEFDETPTAPLETLSGLERDEHGRLEMTCGGAPDGGTPGCGTEVFR